MKHQREKPGGKKPQDPGLRKVAVLVSGLDPAGADAVLEALGPEPAARVRQMMVDLGDVDPKEQRRVIDEFLRASPRASRQHPSGIELDGSLAQKLSVPQTHYCRVAPPADHGRPFRFLHEAEADRLVRVLAGERPQTVALVLSHLPPDQAGSVLARLHATLQVEVVHRLVDLEETDPEILREVEEALQSRLSQQVPMQRRRVAGMKAVAEILKASGGRLGTRILDNLAAHDQPLAERLSPQACQFGDLLRLDDGELSAVFRAAGPELTMTALVGAAPELIDRVLRRLPPSEAENVRRQLDHPGPLRLSDVEAARHEIAQRAQRLALQGSIRSLQDQTVLMA